jgi:peroxiredoxin
MRTILLIALLQVTSSAAEPVRSGCSPDDPQIASAGPADTVKVETALAGGDQTCYRVVLTKSEQPPVLGYVLGERLPAISAFVHRREKASEESARAEAQRARLAVLPKTAGDPIKSNDPLVSTKFDDFSGQDAMGKSISLSGLGGRVTVVSFWSPNHLATLSQITGMKHLYGQLHKSGLEAVGVSMDPHAERINDALDDIPVAFPQMPDRSGLAARYQVDPRLGKTFVLDASHRIVAAGPMGPDIVKAVHQLMDAPPTTNTDGQ